MTPKASSSERSLNFINLWQNWKRERDREVNYHSRNERGDSCTDSADIKISIYYKKFHAPKFNSLNKIDNLLKNTNAREMKWITWIVI